jgi:hypothetical protein
MHISDNNSFWEKCDEKCSYMFNVYRNQLSWQTGSRNLMGPKTLPTIWGTYMMLVTKSYFLFANLVGFYTHWTYMNIFRHIFLSNYCCQRSDIWSQASYRYPISWEAFFDPSDSYFLFAKERGYHRWALAHSSSCFAKICWWFVSCLTFICMKQSDWFQVPSSSSFVPIRFRFAF